MDGGTAVAGTYHRFARVRSYELPPDEASRLTDGRWQRLSQARWALDTIGRLFLNEDELVLLDLVSLGKSDGEISLILGVDRKTAYRQRRRLYSMIVAYGWWLQNDPMIRRIVASRLSQLHVSVLVPLVHRRTRVQIADELGVTQWCVHKKTHDCLRLLGQNGQFLNFMRSLRLRYVH